MIRQIRGTVVGHTPGGVVVEVAGFGIEVHTSSPETHAQGAEIRLLTHLSVKQDGMDLYGFTFQEDLSFFELLITVPGVGPKTALSILQRAPREQLESAIAGRDINYLTKVAGLGKKSAEKLSVLLAEKITATSETSGDTDAEVLDTLVALGYTEREARKVVQRIASTVEGKEARLKAALSQS